jgi:pimeloyl-ACP methyl ester carboxylesterase/class 3 adenylate cyclase
MLPEIKYARSGDVSIAYEVIGDGPIDLIIVHGWVASIEGLRGAPAFDQFIQRLTYFARVIQFDKRGTGMSDRVTQAATLEERMDDVRAVMDDIGSQRAAVMGISEGGVMAALFAATFPERTSALIMYGSYAQRHSPTTEDEWLIYSEEIRHDWGSAAAARQRLAWMAPSLADDKQQIALLQKVMRIGASPSAAIALARMINEIDIRQVLPTIRVPSLIIHRNGDIGQPVADGRYLGEHIPSAKYVELPGVDHLPWIGDADAILDEIEEFLTGARQPLEHNRMLATIMFTDIVSSTERAHELGDRKWLELLDQHNALVRKELVRYRGVEMDTTGDGFFATFDGPARAIRCALAIRDDVQQLGIQVRADLHTGECEMLGKKVGGIAVHIGARVMAHSGGNEVLVSSTVKDLVAGSGIKFEDRGVHALKGVQDEWHLYAVAR